MHPPNDPSNPETSDTKAPLAAQAPAAVAEDKNLRRDFFVVGIGASAGALEPISDVLKHLPLGSNFALILVQHLDPNHASILVELLNRVATLPVQWASNGQAVQPGNVYVAPPKACLSIQ